jgi:PPOX class probable F420-dependent enzyme
MGVPIPEKFRDLFERPVVVSLVTVMPNGQPQATPVWVDYDGTHVIINTARGRQKDKNMHKNAKVTVLAIDPDDPYRWVEVRGRIVEEDEESGLAVINALSKKYRGVEDYYSSNPSRRGQEQRVTYKIEPTHITPK